MAEKKSTSYVSISFLGALTLIFITLKLTHYIDDWSWWEVTAPLWAIPLLWIVVTVIICVFYIPIRFFMLSRKKKDT